MNKTQRLFITLAGVFLLMGVGWVSLPSFAAGIAPDEPVRVRTDATGVDLQIKLSDFTIRNSQPDQVAYDILSFEGQNGMVKQPGAPELPVMDLIVGIPAEGIAALRLISVNTTRLSGHYSLPTAEIPVPLTEDLTAGKMQRVPNDPLSQTDGLFPASPAIIAGEAWIRGQRVIRLQISPFQYNPANRTVSFTSDLNLRIEFTDPVPDFVCMDCDYDAEMESVLQEQIVNYDQSLTWRIASGTQAMQEQIQAPAGSPFLGPRYEIIVDQDGVYHVTYAQLQAAGMAVNSVDPRTFRLFNHGSEVRIRVTGESDGKFDPGDKIIFYGERFRGDIMEARYQSTMTKAGNLPNWSEYAANNWFWQCKQSCELASYFERYTDNNVYYLLSGGPTGQRMSTTSGTPAGAPVPAYFTTTVRAEMSTAWWSHEFEDDDVWFWKRNRLEPATPTFPIVSSYPVQLNGVASGSHTASIYLEFATRSHNPYDSNDYHTQFSINGNLFADNYWDGAQRFGLNANVPQSQLLEGANALGLTMVQTAYFSPDLYFDFYEVTYARNFKAVSDRLAFTYNQAGSWRYKITELTSATAEVYNITDPFNPVSISGVAMTNNSGTYTAEFQVTTGAGVEYIVAGSGSGILTPKKIAAYIPPNFAAMAPADYILITHANFITGTQSLANYRAAQGHTVAVIDVNDLYHEFNDGIYHPIAIKNFLAYTFANWSSPPIYVTLVGNGNWNMKNFGTDTNVLYHNAPPTFMPPNLAYIDPWQGEVDSANLLATIIGNDTIPDVYIGRIPVNTNAQMTTVVNKIIAYENAPVQAWQKNVLFIADNVPDPKFAGDFVALSEGIISDYITPNPDYQALRIYQDTGDGIPNGYDFGCTSLSNPTERAKCDNVTAAIQNTLNITGTLLVNYTGHASLDRWSNEVIFDVNDITPLTNGSQLPVVLSLTCLDGHWTYPNLDSLAYRFLTTSGKGAVAAFSPTGLGVATGHDYLQRGFYNSMFDDGSWELGPATLSAKVNLWGSGFDYDLMHTFTLFGDPAMGIKNDKIVTPAQAAKTGNPGDSVVYTLKVKNTGATADTFSVVVSSPSWTVSPPATTVGPLNAGASKLQEITVNIPSNALSNQYEVTTVSVTSQANASKTGASVLTTTVVVPGLELSPASETRKSVQNEVVTFELTLTNTSAVTDTFDITVDNPGGWSLSAPAQIGPLASGGSSKFNVTVTVPGNAVSGTSETFKVTVRSQYDVTNAAVSNLTVDVVKRFYLPVIYQK